MIFNSKTKLNRTINTKQNEIEISFHYLDFSCDDRVIFSF